MAAITTTLTDMQAAYVHEVVQGTRPLVAAQIAGYAAPKETVYFLGKNPQVQSAIAAGLRRFLYSQAAPAAIHLLYRFMNKKTLDPKLRVMCAKSLADRAGFIPPKAKDNKALDDKSFIDMTAEELREASQRIVKELGDRATITLDNAPSGDDEEPQAIDVFD